MSLKELGEILWVIIVVPLSILWLLFLALLALAAKIAFWVVVIALAIQCAKAVHAQDQPPPPQTPAGCIWTYDFVAEEWVLICT